MQSKAYWALFSISISLNDKETSKYVFSEGGGKPAKLIYLIFEPLEVVSRYRDPQLQVVENYSYMFNLKPDINKF